MDKAATNSHFLSTVEFGSKIASTGAVFVFLAYAIGYLKAAIIYYWLDAYWLIDFHSFQDFIVRGFSTVVVPTLVAGAFLMLGLDGDSHWRIIRYAGLIVLALCGCGAILAKSGYLEVSPKLFAFAEKTFYHLLAGGLLSAMIRTFQETKIFKLRTFSFFSALVYLCILSDGVLGQGVVGQIKSPKPGTTLLTTGDDGKIYVLVNGINGKYLVAECGTAKNVKIVEPSDKVRVFSASGYGCPVKPERSTLKASGLYRRLTSMPSDLVIPYKLK